MASHHIKIGLLGLVTLSTAVYGTIGYSTWSNISFLTNQLGPATPRGWAIIVANGDLAVGLENYNRIPYCGGWTPPVRRPLTPPQIARNLVGSGYLWFMPMRGRHLVIVPFYWIWGAMFGVTLLYVRRVRRRMRDRSRCACGYLVTGNQSGRCPECGRPVSADVE